MKRLIFLFAIVCANAVAGPMAYDSATIYILDAPTSDHAGKILNTSADFVRKNALIKIELGYVLRGWFESFWKDVKIDLSEKERAKPLFMIVDLHDKFHKNPDDTLYCTDKFAFTDEGRYVDAQPFLDEISQALKFRIIHPSQNTAEQDAAANP